AAGMGASPRQGFGRAGLYPEGARGPRSRAALCGGSARGRLRSRHRRGRLQAPGRTGRRRQAVGEGAAMPSRCGVAAIIGAPNAGKSTLSNALVASKVAVVSPKVQTTRMPVRGIAMAGETQIVFVDTPGIFRPRRRLDRAMVAAAWGGAADADIVVLLVEAHRGLTEGVQAIIESLKDRLPASTRVVLAINKIDRVKAETLLSLSQT